MNFKPSSNPFAWKLIIVLIIFSSLITLITTAIQLFLEYDRDINAIKSHFQQVERSYLNSISENVWEADSERLVLLVKGIIAFPDFKFSIVREANGNVLASAGTEEKLNSIRQAYQLKYLFRGTVLNIGELEVIATLSGVYDRIYERIGLILIANAVKTFLISIFLFLIIHWLLTRHLAQMVSFARKMNFLLPSEEIKLERGFMGNKRDEVDELADSLNDMRGRLLKSFKEQQESEKRLKDVAETAYDRIWETDINFRFSSVLGDRVANTYPLPENMIGLTRWEACKGDIEKNIKWRSHYKDHVDHRSFRDFEYTVTNEYGEANSWRVNGKPFYDAAGNFAGHRGSSSNITARKRAEETANWLLNAIDIVSETVAIYDHEDRLVFCNQTFRDRNQAVADFIVPGVKYEDYLRAAVAKGLITDAIGMEESWIIERLQRHQACGDIFEVARPDSHLLINEQRLPDGGIATIAIDLSAQKKAEEKVERSRARVQEILSLAPEAVITTGYDMRIQLFNKGAERIFGYNASEVLGQPMDILIPEHLRQGHLKHIKGFDTSSDTYRFMDQRDGISGLRKDGTVFPASASVSKIEVGGEKVFTIMLHDTTERRRAEEDRRKALNEAEKSSRAKTEFLATMSHEFRTPLNAILGFSEMLRSQYFGPLGDVKYQDYANDIHNSGEHMLALVNDVLDVSAIEAGKRSMEKEKINIDTLFSDCIRKVKNHADNNRLHLSLKISNNLPSLYADKRSATQIIFNLLSNAIKFTKKGGEVLLSAKVDKGCIVISIKDTGIGIPANKLSVITEPFSQANDNPHNTQEGTGLGLNIVKSLIEAHEGELSIDSEVEKGTTVTVTFPLHEDGNVQ